MSSLPDPTASRPPGCPLCGTPVRPDDLRCPSCGYPLDVAPSRLHPPAAVNLGILAAVLAGIYLATLAVVAAAR